LALGSAGGKRIVSAVAYTALHAMWLNLNVKDAVDRARLIQLLPGYTYYEDGFPSVRMATIRITDRLNRRCDLLFRNTLQVWKNEAIQ
jgi:gamma-glutamyltranspeptidase